MGNTVTDECPLLTARAPGGVREAVRRAAETLQAGGLVAFPTESFYGLGADAGNEAAVRRLFRVKERSSDLPILVLLHEAAYVEGLVICVPETARKLMAAFWPGGLTLVFHASAAVSQQLTAGTGKIGIRVSGHPVARALAREVGVPITGTSANRSGAPACRTPAEVLDQLGNRLDAVLDGGRTPGERVSTILDVTLDPPKILREGLVSRRRLESVVRLSRSRRHPGNG